MPFKMRAFTITLSTPSARITIRADSKDPSDRWRTFTRNVPIPRSIGLPVAASRTNARARTVWTDTSSSSPVVTATGDTRVTCGANADGAAGASSWSSFSSASSSSSLAAAPKPPRAADASPSVANGLAVTEVPNPFRPPVVGDPAAAAAAAKDPNPFSLVDDPGAANAAKPERPPPPPVDAVEANAEVDLPAPAAASAPNPVNGLPADAAADPNAGREGGTTAPGPSRGTGDRDRDRDRSPCFC
ncbi:hypothetical protein BC828DRAFT_373513 [Blastocladiella britannica]|nr:hypothetical protein BC828DRAFT_373513 [Blastocladiella britannica]